VDEFCGLGNHNPEKSDASLKSAKAFEVTLPFKCHFDEQNRTIKRMLFDHFD
jgi:hypothetical protein